MKKSDMEYETKVKVDPIRSEKVFTASQVMEAFKVATHKAASEASKAAEVDRDGHLPGVIVGLMTMSLAAMIATAMEKELGIDGPDGGYIDKKA